jgi:small-conductance mechanosensitive channel
VLRGDISPEVDTRLRVLERFVYALVLTIGIAVALSKFDAVRDIGRALLTSGAIAAAVIGFAARQTLANIVAGVMIAITQPIRIGDWIAYEDDYGVVEDITLNFTVVRTGADQRVVIPNEKIASNVVRNDSLVNPEVGLDVSVWVPARADSDRAIAALEDETGSGVTIAEATPWGTRLSVGGDPVAPSERPAREADLRARCVRRLRAEGLLETTSG